MDNTSDTRPTRNRWQRLLKGRQKQKVDVIENVAKYDKNAINMLDIIWKEWLVDPAEQFYYVWLQVMILPIVYNSVIIILRTCFTTIALSYLPVWLTLDYLSDLMYIVDMIITVHTGYLDQGILVKDLTQLKQRYLHSKAFLRDLASLIPTDLLYFVFGIQTPLVRINRLLRMPRLNEALDRMETRTSYPNTFRISKLMIYIFVLIHWNACLYFALSSYIGFGSDRWVYPNITNPEFASLRRQYIYCFWFSAQIFTTVGDTPLPKREDEYLFMIADLLIAVLVFASIVGNVGNVITSLRDRDNVFFPNHELVKAYLSSHQISKELRHRIDNWYQHLHINKKIIRENEILQELPLHLRTEIAVSVHLSTLSKVTIFHNCDRSLLEELVLKLTPQVFSPGEYVCKKGDVGHEMYIIKEGKLAVVADDGVTEFAVLSDGNFFGEISIINIKGNKSGNRRTANIRSIGHSDLFSLSKEALMDVLSEFPAAKRHLEEKGRQILTKMGMLEENGDGGEGEAATVETKIKKLESSLESLHTKLARLMAELESSNAKMQVRVELLEWEVAALHTDLSKEEEDARGVQGRGEGVGGEVQLEREEAEGEEEWEASDLKMKRQRQGEDVFNEGDGQSTTSTKEDVRKIEVDNCCGSKDPEFHEQNQDVRKIVREDGNDRLGKGDGAEMEPAEMSSGESEEKECELKTQKSEEKTN
ncbi:cyclic nucleotide-gated cation channel alpha-4 isoform X1 [Takifugu flavidus]|uniref:cyclic nucleotide-gated cation channel alpha-4 isoform X1 n=1 Tax=Takifugu flavidus TaxID=433684 RepID=UPI00254465FB|nr:cyclic nucleotide-gated cation channel alpha-4 isoform X1 [Takifugu flavidus]XP_056904553.1 cyclic nucleotide-gated cation channel alpha-4 isoform X1 [Takifugu flavidus]